MPSTLLQSKNGFLTNLYWIRLLAKEISLTQCACNHRSRKPLVCSSTTAKRTLDSEDRTQDIHISWLFCFNAVFFFLCSFYCTTKYILLRLNLHRQCHVNHNHHILDPCFHPDSMSLVWSRTSSSLNSWCPSKLPEKTIVGKQHE